VRRPEERKLVQQVRTRVDPVRGQSSTLVIVVLLDKPEYRAPIRAGWALAVVGACTLTWWVLRVKGRSAPPKALQLAGTVSLLVAVVLGVVTSLPHILSAAGMP
jgi:hypothetical protein